MSRNTDGYWFKGHKLNKNLQSSNNIEIKENIIERFEESIGFSKNWELLFNKAVLMYIQFIFKFVFSWIVIFSIKLYVCTVNNP